MAEDIAPELLKKIQDMFRSGIDQDQRVAELKEKLDAGSATYHEAHEYASLVGGHMKDAYMEYLTSDNLPDGKCYYNIAERIIGTTEHEQYELVSQYAQEVQTALNKNAGIGMKAQAAGEDTTRVEGLVNVASNADQYDRVSKTVAQGVESMAREVVDRSVEKNAGFQRQSGLRPKIIRSSGGKCCDWCAALDGTYDYDKAPKEIYARHNNCTCTVEYDPGSGRRQDVWSKRWISEEELAKREELKTLGLDNLSGSDKIEYRKTIGLSADKNNESAVPEHAPPELIGELGSDDRKEVLLSWEKVISEESVENAIVITTSGEIYRCRGTLNGVYPDTDLGDKLFGADVTHNHPIGSNNEYSFSGADLRLFSDYSLNSLRGIDDIFQYELNRNSTFVDPPIPIEEADEYSMRHTTVTSNALKNGYGYRRWRRDGK